MLRPDPDPARPRIAYLVKRYPRYSETFIVNEILAHERAGWELEIFSLNPPGDSHFQDAIARVRAPVSYLSAGGLKASGLWEAYRGAASWAARDGLDLLASSGAGAREVFQALRLAAEVRGRRLSLIHAHFATSAATVARLAARLASVPYTLTAHAKDIFHEGVDDADLVAKLTDASARITVSDYNVRFLAGRLPAAPPAERVYNGLDLDRFSYLPPLGRPPLILGVGRLVEKKGFEDLIAACALLRDRAATFRCEIVGAGELEQALRGQIERLGLGALVDLVGPRPQAEIVDAVRSAGVFCAPCVVGGDGNRDGLPTVLIEAMALGTPCVATDVTGIPELLNDGVTGLCVAQRDPHALAGALERLLRDEALALELAGRARRRVERDFDIRRTAARQRELFLAALALPAAERRALEPA